MKRNNGRVWAFLRRPGIRARLLSTSNEGRPALEGIVRDFEATFEHECQDPAFRAGVGKRIKVVMWESGYSWVSKGHALRDSTIFKQASRYVKGVNLERLAAG